MVSSPIGEQVARLRVLRGWSQEQLAHRAGISVDTVRKLESGNRGMVRLATLSRIASALDVELAMTLTLPAVLGPVEDGGVMALRRALTSPDLLGLADYAEPGPVPDLTALAADVARAWEVWQQGEYAALAATLPDMIAEARHATRELSGDDQVQAWGLLATTYQVAAGVTVMTGHENLAWTAVERALDAADRAADPVAHASAEHFVAWIYRRQGRYTDCQSAATRSAERHEPRLSQATPEELSVWGGLLVNASGAAARQERAEVADELLSVASGAAARLGHDRWDRWSVFGPRLVAQTAVINAVEMGDMERALHRSAAVPDGRLPPTWDARYLLALAEAQVESHRDADALATLTEAARVTPEWVRYHRLARDITLELCERSGARRSQMLDDLVNQLGLVPA